MRASDDAGGYWRLLPLVLLVGLVLRIGLALTTNTIVHADELMQYLEPAHRLVFKVGVTTWEYRYGIRSWIIPGFIAVILEALRAVGLGRPEAYDPAIRIAFCLVSLSLSFNIYRTARIVVDERAARVALILASGWYELLYYAHKPLADALSIYALFAALPFAMKQAHSRGAAFAFGFLCGLVLALRFQMAPAVIVVLAVAAWRWRRLRGWALAGLAAMIAASGLLDAYTWGVPFSSVVINLQLNLFAHVADAYSTAPPSYYLFVLAVTSGGLVVLGVAGLVMWRRTAWPLLAVGFAILAGFSAIAHKEPRFVFGIVPFALIGLGALAAWFVREDRRPVRAARWAVAGVTLAALAVSMTGLTGRLPMERLVYRDPILGRDDTRDAYRFLSRQSDLTGVIDQHGDRARLYGYYDLHKTAPLYRADVDDGEQPAGLDAPALYASHWIRPLSAPPAGYHLIQVFGRLGVWRRDRDPAVTLKPRGYSDKIPYTDRTPYIGRVVRPAVTPRW
jgi:hypothetical protein